MDKYVYDWLADMKITFERIADSLEILAAANQFSSVDNIALNNDGVQINYKTNVEDENLK